MKIYKVEVYQSPMTPDDNVEKGWVTVYSSDSEKDATDFYNKIYRVAKDKLTVKMFKLGYKCFK
jgi:rubrerythrin